MFTVPHWSVLVVDDDADIHAATELALKREKICGAPVKVHHADSARQAKEMLAEVPFQIGIAVAIIDVIMETDKAGLDLCKYIRDDLGMAAIQLIMRTGQPGVAPPRAMVDSCNISSYVTKHEADRERLYVLAKQGVYSFFAVRQAMIGGRLADVIRTKAAKPSEVFPAIEAEFRRDWGDVKSNVGIEVGDQYMGAGYFEQRAVFEKAKAECLRGGEPEAKNQAQSRVYPNPVSRVGDYVFTQVKSVRDGRVATLITHNATLPEGLENVYGPQWRLFLGYLAELGAK